MSKNHSVNEYFLLNIQMCVVVFGKTGYYERHKNIFNNRKPKVRPDLWIEIKIGDENFMPES